MPGGTEGKLVMRAAANGCQQAYGTLVSTRYRQVSRGIARMPQGCLGFGRGAGGALGATDEVAAASSREHVERQHETDRNAGEGGGACRYEEDGQSRIARSTAMFCTICSLVHVLGWLDATKLGPHALDRLRI